MLLFNSLSICAMCGAVCIFSSPTSDSRSNKWWSLLSKLTFDYIGNPITYIVSLIYQKGLLPRWCIMSVLSG